jgi:SAM-dependent methyltransferase
MNKESYLKMQREVYDADASLWTLENRNPVVGSYDEHNLFEDYDTYLFKGIDTSAMHALEYGCGPGRNMIRFAKRFNKIDGVDISSVNRQKALLNLKAHGIDMPDYYVTSGDCVPTSGEKYDMVFSVICLQHICSHHIRKTIMNEIWRVLKRGGHFCAQMGFGGSARRFANYHEDVFDADGTNGSYDVSIIEEDDLINDLAGIGFTNYSSDIARTGPGDCHRNWIWFRAQKI